MYFNTSPFTAIISACFPTDIVPTLSETSIKKEGQYVADLIASKGSTSIMLTHTSSSFQVLWE